MKLTFVMLTPEELIKALQDDFSKHLLLRRCGKRFTISLAYHLNRLLVLEKENAELKKKLSYYELRK